MDTFYLIETDEKNRETLRLCSAETEFLKDDLDAWLLSRGIVMDWAAASATVDAHSIADQIVARLKIGSARPNRARSGNSAQLPALLTFNQAARALGVSRNKALHELMGTGQIKTVKFRGKLRIPKSEIDRLELVGETSWPTRTSPSRNRRAPPGSVDIPSKIDKLPY